MKPCTQHSFTRVRHYESCPLSLRYYLLKAPQDDMRILHLGSLAHRVFEEYIQWCEGRQVPTDYSALMPIADRCYQDEYKKAKGPYLSRQDFDALYEDVLQPWAQNHMFQGAFNVEYEVAVDRNLAAVQWLAPTVWVRAKIDLLEFGDDRLTVTDWKTGWSTEASELQLQMYAWLMLHLFGMVKEVDVMFDFVRYNLQVKRTYTPEDLPGLDRLIVGKLEAVEQETEWRPTPGPQCLTCNYSKHCDVMAKPVLEIDDLDHAADAIESIAILERDLKHAKASLKAFCDRQGPVTHNNVSWGYHREGYAWKFDDAALFLAAGIDDAASYLNVDNRRVQKLANEDGTFPAPLQAIAVPGGGLKFKGKKVKA